MLNLKLINIVNQTFFMLFHLHLKSSLMLFYLDFIFKDFMF